MLSQAFNCEPFNSQDEFDNPTDRSVPFFLRYRDNDPHHPSCAAGMQLSKKGGSLNPGLYYEDAGGNWVRFGTDSPKEEVAFLFYIHRESQGRLEMVMGGFSGRATRLLARAIGTRSQDFWPPSYEMQGLQVGAFLIKFTLPTAKKESDILRTDLVATTEVMRLPVEAISRRLDGSLKKLV
jgi:hypothetical protein